MYYYAAIMMQRSDAIACSFYNKATTSSRVVVAIEILVVFPPLVQFFLDLINVTIVRSFIAVCSCILFL